MTMKSETSAGLYAPGHAVAERLERLPRTWWTYKIVLICCLAWLFEAFDIGLIGVVLPPLTQLWHLRPGDVSQLAIASTVGIVIGVVPSGILADQIGRKRMLIIGMSEATLLTLVAAGAPNLRWLVTLRFLAGLGMGAMFPLPYALVTEFVSSRLRGPFTGSWMPCSRSDILCRRCSARSWFQASHRTSGGEFSSYWAEYRCCTSW
jgi:putative MFS transporter